MLKFVIVLGLEAYAVALASLQSLGGVRTDEAKYLLDIPYPHPPLARWLFSLTESVPFQEWFWRIVLATLVVQAVWLVWSMCDTMKRGNRIAICALWVCSASVLLQAGTVMMAPLTALQGLLFIWLWQKPRHTASWAALLWLCTLFTAYQGFLYLPLLLAILRRSKLSWVMCAFIVGVPMALAALYALGNPLSLASFVNAGTDNSGKTFIDIFGEFIGAWAVGGSLVMVFSGTWGMVRAKAWPLIATIVLLSAYNFASVHDYYAILFTPLLVAGTALLVRRYPPIVWPVLIMCVIGSSALFLEFHPVVQMSNSRRVMQTMNPKPDGGFVLINGSFGHEWQYESTAPVRRFAPELLGQAQSIICIAECPDLGPEWKRVMDIYVETYIK